MNIGIIGYGVVGQAIYKGFESKATLHVYDPLYPPEQAPYFKSSCAEVWGACDYVFVAVPTPQKLKAGQLGGEFDSSHVDQTFSDLAPLAASDGADKRKILILTSTTLPSKINEYRDGYPQINLVVLPEFLTGKNAHRDFLNPEFRIIGGDPEYTCAVQDLFEEYSNCTPCKVGYCDDAAGAAFIKYMSNSYLALKVSFLNQFHNLFEQSGSRMTWTELSELFHYDTRMGTSHKHVPGHDDDRGWGGRCLPKDTNAIMRDARKQGSPLSLLEEAWEYNLRIRSKTDWL